MSAPNTKPLPPMIFEDDFIEHNNVAWRIEPAQPDPHNPLLEPKYPWDSASPCVGHGTVIKDPIDGLYKAWTVSAADYSGFWGDFEFRLTYAYSEDGVNWVRPELDICPFPDYPKTNILFDYNSGGRSTYASVLIDPVGNPDEPYEMFLFRHPWFKNPSLTVQGFSGRNERSLSLYRYRSKDGLRWRGIEGPYPLKTDDSMYIHTNKESGYVAHFKDCVSSLPGGYAPYDCAAGRCRVHFRMTSKDGANWGQPALIMQPDWKDHPGSQFMEVGYYPYGEGIIGLTAIFNATSQTQELHFAASKDGLKWWRPARRPCLPLAPTGDYGGGLIWPTRTLIEDNDKLYTYYGATDGLHGDVYNPTPNMLRAFSGAFCRAWWDVGRMWAAVPAAGGDLEASLITPLMKPEGENLYINGVTVRDGEIRAEILHPIHNPGQAPQQKVVGGFSKAECIPFKGDHKCEVIRWNGRDGGSLRGQNVHVKLSLRRARLYGFEWR